MAEDATVTVGQAAGHLGLSLCAGRERGDEPITGALVGDLLSHVMAYGKQGNVWITIQTHPNILAVAALGGLAAVVIADGFEPEGETIGRADEEGIPLYTSPESSYRLAGRLYELGVR